MHYEIHRGLKSGQSLNTAQRTSSLFAEEPVVLGKVFRRGYPPIVLTETQFELNKTHLTRLEKAGAIVIKKQEYKKLFSRQFHSRTLRLHLLRRTRLPSLQPQSPSRRRKSLMKQHPLLK